MSCCLHCKAEIKGANHDFCCIGCEHAYIFIKKLNLKQYYDYCRDIYSTKPKTVDSFENSFVYEDQVVQKGKEQQIYLLVEGIYCGACVWLIENSLQKHPEVTLARINMSTRRLTLRWCGLQSDIKKYVAIIHALGYKLIPYTNLDRQFVASAEEKAMLRYIIVAGSAFVQVMMLAIAIWAGNHGINFGEYTRLFFHITSAIIVLPATIYSSKPFYTSAFIAIKNGTTNMDVPITIAIFATLLISIQELLHNKIYTYFDSAIMLVFALLISRYLSIRSKNNAQIEAHKLVLAQSYSATIMFKNRLKLVNINKVQVNDIIIVASGERVPVDGILLDAVCEADTSVITGEIAPKVIKKGDMVCAGTINLSDTISIKLVNLGENTVISQIIQLIENAGQKKAKYQLLADKVAGIYTPLVLILALTTFVFWSFYIKIYIYDALLYATSVLIITCPCALGLAVPIAQVIASTRLMRHGILLKSSDALERLSQITEVVFDKTGTLTTGKPRLINKNQIDRQDMQIIATLASYSKHPLCIAIVNSYSGNISKTKVKEVKGEGLEAIIDNKLRRLGNGGFCNIDSKSDSKYMQCWYSTEGRDAIELRFSDILYDSSLETVKYFNHAVNNNITILSGDKRQVVCSVAKKLGIKKYIAESKPQDKYQFIYNKVNKKILMIGDGINDASALKLAYISASHAEAIDIAQNSADIIFQQQPLQMVTAHRIAINANRIMKQNIIISLIYNVVVVPIAMMGMVIPQIAALSMSLSSLIVIVNSCRLNKIT